jgi:hypothetical protein
MARHVRGWLAPLDSNGWRLLVDPAIRKQIHDADDFLWEHYARHERAKRVHRYVIVLTWVVLFAMAAIAVYVLWRPA